MSEAGNLDHQLQDDRKTFYEKKVKVTTKRPPRIFVFLNVFQKEES